MPAQKPLPAPVSTPTDSSVARRRARSSAAAIPSATAALTALRWSGRLIVITKHALAALGQDCCLVVHAANSRSSGARSPRRTPRSTSTQPISRDCASTRACGLISCAARTPRQVAKAGSSRIRSQVPGQLLDGVDARDALDLDRHPLSSASRHIRSTGPMSVGHSRRTSRKPSPHQCGCSASSSCRCASTPSLASAGLLVGRSHVVGHVGEDLRHVDLEPILRLARPLAHDDLRCGPSPRSRSAASSSSAACSRRCRHAPARSRRP